MRAILILYVWNVLFYRKECKMFGLDSLTLWLCSWMAGALGWEFWFFSGLFLHLHHTTRIWFDDNNKADFKEKQTFRLLMPFLQCITIYLFYCVVIIWSSEQTEVIFNDTFPLCRIGVCLKLPMYEVTFLCKQCHYAGLKNFCTCVFIFFLFLRSLWAKTNKQKILLLDIDFSLFGLNGTEIGISVLNSIFYDVVH